MRNPSSCLIFSMTLNEFRRFSNGFEERFLEINENLKLEQNPLMSRSCDFDQIAKTDFFLENQDFGEKQRVNKENQATNQRTGAQSVPNTRFSEKIGSESGT